MYYSAPEIIYERSDLYITGNLNKPLSVPFFLNIYSYD